MDCPDTLLDGVNTLTEFLSIQAGSLETQTESLDNQANCLGI